MFALWISTNYFVCKEGLQGDYKDNKHDLILAFLFESNLMLSVDIVTTVWV